MRDTHLKYKRETGSSDTQTEITAEIFHYDDNYLIIEKEELDMIRTGVKLKMTDPDYFTWLEEQVRELSEKLELIDSTIQK